VESGLCFGKTISGESSINKGDKGVSRVSYIHDMSFTWFNHTESYIDFGRGGSKKKVKCIHLVTLPQQKNCA